MRSVLVAVNVAGLPDTLIPAPLVGNPEMLAGSVIAAVAVAALSGPTPSVQLGTVARPVVLAVVTVVDVTTVELDAGPKLPPPAVIAKATEAPPSGVCP